MKHLPDSDLALRAGADTGFWSRLRMDAHLNRCAECRARLDEFGQVRKALRETSDDLPAGVNWNVLAREMTANIHLGVSAGRCVAPGSTFAWHKPALVLASTLLVVLVAWVAYLPTAGTPPAGMMAETSASGIDLNDNGRVLTLRHSAEQEVISVSLQGSVRARYVDSETGQVTINNVYVQ